MRGLKASTPGTSAPAAWTTVTCASPFVATFFAATAALCGVASTATTCPASPTSLPRIIATTPWWAPTSNTRAPSSRRPRAASVAISAIIGQS